MLLPEDAAQLTSLPLEIREKPAQEVINYVFDLVKASAAVPLFRTKLMVVGYEKVGKTSLLEHLFPSTTTSPVTLSISSSSSTPAITTEVLRHVTLKLVGKELLIFDSPATTNTTATTKLNLKEGKWTITSSPNTSSSSHQLTVELCQQQQQGESKNHRTFTFTFTNKSDGDEFAQRLKRITGDERTHGIDIRKQEIPVTIPSESGSLKRRQETLEASVWDFAGQHSYYHNHHYFLSARSVFLVVWNVLKGQEGVDGLEFWLKSLKTHLPATTSASTSASKPQQPQQQLLYSIIVVGTHIDGLVDAEKMRPLRKQQLRELFEVKCEMGAVPFEYVEVSNQSGANIDDLHSVIIELALSHSDMGELIPQSYLKVESVVMKLREEKRLQQQKGDDVLPIVSLKNEFLPRVKREFGKGVDDSAAECLRALGLLHVWGACVHFDDSSLMSEYVVLDPTFLTQEVMTSLFHPDCAGFLKNGKLLHKQLRVIWPKDEQQAEFLMSLMEKV